MIPRRQFLQLGLAATCLAAPKVVGLIFPTANRPVPPEAATLYPKIRFLAAGIGLGQSLPEEFDSLLDRTIPAAVKLKQQGATTIALMSPPLTFYKGAAFNRRLTAELTRATNLPCLTASTAIVNALKSAYTRRLAIATVYTDEVSLHLQGFLEESGFEIVTVRGLGIDRFEERAPIAEPITLDEFQQFCIKVRESRPEADALLVCSGYLPSLALIEPLEKRCRVPVISATPAVLRAITR